MSALDPATLSVGDRVWLGTERRPYRVRARGPRYLVCTKPYNPKRTVMYTVIDLNLNIRGTENLIFCCGAETDEQCQEMVDRLEGRTLNAVGEATEVSYRNRVPLDIVRIARQR